MPVCTLTCDSKFDKHWLSSLFFQSISQFGPASKGILRCNFLPHRILTPFLSALGSLKTGLSISDTHITGPKLTQFVRPELVVALIRNWYDVW